MFLISYGIMFVIIAAYILGWIPNEKAKKYEANARELKKSLKIYESANNLMKKANANLVKNNKSLRKRLIIAATENERLKGNINLILPIAKKLSAYIIGAANMCDMDAVLLLGYSKALAKSIAGIKK